MRDLRSLAVPLLALLSLACGKSNNTNPPTVDAGPGAPDAGMFVIEIDIDDHGLKALWNANAPNLQRLVREGTLAYTRVIVPTHSNESNMTLVTGNYPDGHNVPTNSWLNRQKGYTQGLELAGLGLGDYVYYDQNPLNPSVAHHVSSVWSTMNAAQIGTTTYVGQLPPWELGANEVHFALANTTLQGITLDTKSIRDLLTTTLRYPADLVHNTFLDGPPNTGESIAHFAVRDAADVWKAAAATTPPRYMFVWSFLALDGDPTSKYGADAAEIIKIVEDYDDAVGQLLANIDASPYKGRVNILFTLDHGKTNTTQQVNLGDTNDPAKGNVGQLGDLVADQPDGGTLLPDGGNTLTSNDYAILNEDGDALLYAKCIDPVTKASGCAPARQQEITHRLVDLIQSGALVGVDTTRTITWDGYRGTRRMHDYRVESPNQADVIVLPKTGWTLNDVDGTGTPGVFDTTVHPNPYGRHGGFSQDELYVPLIMWGPAFKHGVLLPHPVNHVDVAPTAMAILGQHLTDAEGAPITAAFAGDTSETLAYPSDMNTSRDLVLNGSGFGTTPLALGGTPAQQAVIVDVAGLGYDELFTDPVTATHAAAFRTLAAAGVNFSDAWGRSRDGLENLFELATGSTPVLSGTGAWVPGADADGSMTQAPGLGLRLAPAAAVGTPSNPAALQAWQGKDPWATASLFSAAEANGFAAAVFGPGTTDATAHLNADASLTVTSTQDSGTVAALTTFLGAHPKAVALVTMGGKRTGDRHAAAALAELDALGTLLTSLRAAAPNALFVVTSHAAAEIEEPKGDFYGPQTARHVPFIVVGPNVRSNVLTGQPVTHADVPATVLFGLGVPVTTDFVEGTWATAPANADGVPQPLPANATAGHVVARAFTLH